MSDQYGDNYWVWFDVHIENHLSAQAKDDKWDIYVASNETATLEVKASCDAGEPSYQWYRYNEQTYEDEPVEGATSASYTTGSITDYTRYYCRVSDDYGDSQYVYFYIYIENHLSAQAKDYQNTIYVALNGTATLEVVASCDAGELSYQWYQNGLIEGATSASYTTDSITDYTEYQCIVSDQYGNTQYIWFYIYIEKA